jgi:hypothetical protein
MRNSKDLNCRGNFAVEQNERKPSQLELADSRSVRRPASRRPAGRLTPWAERLTNFVLEFTAMILTLEIHREAQRASTVAADSSILSKGAQL